MFRSIALTIILVWAGSIRVEASSLTYKGIDYTLDENGYLVGIDGKRLRGKPILITASNTKYDLQEDIVIPPDYLTLTYEALNSRLGRTVAPALSSGNFIQFNIDRMETLGLLYDNQRAIALYLLKLY